MEESTVNELKGMKVSRVLESDSEALSSLLMLANSNPRKDDAVPPPPPPANARILASTGMMPNSSNSVPVRPLPASAPSHPSIAYRPPPARPFIPATASNKEITLNDLRKYFHLPITEVASRLGTCTTALKKVCRRLNISKWPYRQILSITKSIQSLEMATMADHVDDKQREHFRQQISLLRRMLTEVIKHPNKTIEDCHMVVEPTLAAATTTTQETSEGGGDGEGEGDDSNTVNAIITKAQTQPHYTHSKHFSDSDDPTEEIVQQIIKAAAENMNASLSFIGGNSSSSSSRKRKSGADSDSDAVDVNKQVQKKASADELTNLHHRDIQAPQALQTQLQQLDQQLQPRTTTTNAAISAVASASSSSSRWPQLELGLTKLKFSHNTENETYTFLGPIQLAPLQRRKFKVNNPAQQRRIVPLMEPDVGGNASVEFVPQTIVNALKKKMDDHNLMQMANALQLPPLPDDQSYRDISNSSGRK